LCPVLLLHAFKKEQQNSFIRTQINAPDTKKPPRRTVLKTGSGGTIAR
tara:strand:- start:4371 stop:4514 length:144 start_codon:yes stop_codon:yes gene_type:complete